jgi:tyrosyl-DNA phosphodiesterase 2
VWFDPTQAEARAAALLRCMEVADADVLCLQEVNLAFLHRALAASWIRREYAVSDAVGASVDPYGALLLSRIPLDGLICQELPTSMERTLVAGTVRVGGHALAIGTVHLESRRHNSDVRMEQLAIALPALRAITHDALLCGDLNFDPEDEEEALLRPDWRDVWTTLRGLDPGYTVDTIHNAMGVMPGKEKQVRFDRMLLSGEAWRPRSIRRIGTEPLDAARPDLYPSDHFGLRAEFAVAGRGGPGASEFG